MILKAPVFGFYRGGYQCGPARVVAFDAVLVVHLKL